MISRSVRLGANMDINGFLEDMAVYLWGGDKVLMIVKMVQPIKTVSTQMILGLLSKKSVDIVKKLTNMLLKN